MIDARELLLVRLVREGGNVAASRVVPLGFQALLAADDFLGRSP